MDLVVCAVLGGASIDSPACSQNPYHRFAIVLEGLRRISRVEYELVGSILETNLFRVYTVSLTSGVCVYVCPPCWTFQVACLAGYFSWLWLVWFYVALPSLSQLRFDQLNFWFPERCTSLLRKLVFGFTFGD